MKIPYTVKRVAANTEYRNIQPAHKRAVMNRLREIAELSEGCWNSTDSHLRSIGLRMRAPNRMLPRKGRSHGGGMNSVESAATGIIDNIENGTQRDFSNHTCRLVERTFAEVARIFTDWPQIEFVLVDEFDAVLAPVPEPETQAQPLPDTLWETQVYEVAITRKR